MLIKKKFKYKVYTVYSAYSSEKNKRVFIEVCYESPRKEPLPSDIANLEKNGVILFQDKQYSDFRYAYRVQPNKDS